jgi:hypothetical protein
MTNIISECDEHLSDLIVPFEGTSVYHNWGFQDVTHPSRIRSHSPDCVESSRSILELWHHGAA